MKTMTLRFTALFLVAALLLLMLVGCGKDQAADPAAETVRGPGYDDLIESDTLVMYLMEEMSVIDQRIINQFQSHTGISVEVVLVPMAEYGERLKNDMAAGGGPDVFYIEQGVNLDVKKAALNHNFLDLTDILAEDPDFNREDYIPNVFEDCRIGGRQYVIPTSYYAPALMSSASMLDGFGFRWDRVDTISDFLTQIAKLSPGAENFKGFKQMLFSQNRFDMLYRYAGLSLIDYEAGEVLPDEKGLQEFLEAYKSYFPFDYDPNGVANYSNHFYDPLRMGEVLFADPSDIEQVQTNTNILWEFDHEAVLHMTPGQKGEPIGTVARPLVIRANSPNTKNAYEFVKYILSEEAQTDVFSITAYPILKSAVEYFAREGPAFFRNRGFVFYDYENTAFTEEEADAFLAQLSEVRHFQHEEPYQTATMLFDTMLPYFKDEDSYENCLAELRSKLTFYLSE